MILQAYIAFGHRDLVRRFAYKSGFDVREGWRYIDHDALPSLRSLAELVENYASLITFDNVNASCATIEQFRTFDTVVIENEFCWRATFFLPSGSLMLLIPWKSGHSMHAYVMGEATIGDCAIVTGALNRAFEKHVMPKEMRAAEPLLLKRGRG
jgi:hypothetical protein